MAYVTRSEVIARLAWPDVAITQSRVDALIPVAQELIDSYLGYTFDVEDEGNPDDPSVEVIPYRSGPTVFTIRPFRSLVSVSRYDRFSDQTSLVDSRLYTLWPKTGIRKDANGERLYYGFTTSIVGDESYHRDQSFSETVCELYVNAVWGTENVPATVVHAMCLIIQNLSANENPRIKLEQSPNRMIEWFESKEGNLIVPMHIRQMLSAWREIRA